MRNKPLIVIGMHRSGTSALSGELAHLGVFMGKSLLKPQKGVNDKGFWENAKLVELNDTLFDEKVSSWDDPASLIRLASLPELDKSFLLLMECFISTEYQNCELWGMKDPRVSILLPFWNKVFERLSIKPNYILMIRHPFEVVNSLKKRDGFSQSKALMLWLNYNFSSYLHSQNHSRIIVDFEQLLTNPVKIRKMISQKFSVKFENNQKDSFIEKSLKRQSGEEQQELGFLGGLSTSLYQAINIEDDKLVESLYCEYMDYLNSLDTVLLEHLFSVQQLESHFRVIFEEAYNSFSWKLMYPLRKIEKMLRK